MSAELKVLSNFYDFMLWLIRRTEKFPRHHRYSLGFSMENRLALAKTGPAEVRVLAAGADDLSELFGLELGTTGVARPATGSKAGAKPGGGGHVARR
ncbi:MAG: hypothetical protein AB1486_26680 [Planctomycetota bacterium]